MTPALTFVADEIEPGPRPRVAGDWGGGHGRRDDRHGGLRAALLGPHVWLEHGGDGFALLLVPGRKVKLHPGRVLGFVAIDPSRHIRGALDENPSGGSDVHRVEVIAILEL